MESHTLNFLQGLYSDTSPLLVPDGSNGGAAGLMVMNNCTVSYKLGAIMKRPGYVQIGSTLEAGKDITGLHNFRQSSSVQKMLATCNDATDDDTQLFYSTGGAWTEITAAETAWANHANGKVEMADFIGYCFFVGYDATDGWLPVGSLTGTTFSTATNVTNMPNAKYVLRYRDRLYILNCYESATAYPYRTYFSSIPSAGSITWTVASDYFDVDFSEEITGGSVNWDRLMIFTEYSAYMYDQSTKKKVWDIGCSAHRTIKNSGQLMFWANMDNVWASSGGFPEAIGGRVVDFIRATDMRDAFAEIVDEEYRLYLGTVTVNGITYSNCSVIYNIPTGTWRTEEYYDTVTMMAKFYSAGEDYVYIGADDGEVHRLGKYTDATLLTSDDGAPISSWFQTGGLTYGAPHIQKSFDKIIAYADRAQGLLLKMRVIDRNTISLSRFDKLGMLKKYINEFQVNGKEGHILQFEGVENGSLPYWSFFGITTFVTPDVITKP